MNSKPNKKPESLIIILLAQILWIQPSAAQSRDEAATFRKFMQVVNATKTAPLDLRMEMQYHANLITSAQDTARVEGDFHLRSGQSYIRIGDQEQLVNDSMALLVSDSLHQMILYRNARAMVSHMRGLPGLMLPDSSVKKMASQFRSTPETSENGSSAITLQSRALIDGARFPQFTYQLFFDKTDAFPKKLVSVQRSLMVLDSTYFNLMYQEPAYQANLLAIKGGYYFVKERVLTVTYRRMESRPGNEFPVAIADRIELDSQGQYRPLKKYQAYQLVSAD